MTTPRCMVIRATPATPRGAAAAAGVLWAVKEKAKPGRRLTARQRALNHRFGKVRAKVEHVFRVVKCQFGYRKVRYRGIAKNGAQVFSLLALANRTSPAGRLRLPDDDSGQNSPACHRRRGNFCQDARSKPATVSSTALIRGSLILLPLLSPGSIPRAAFTAATSATTTNGRTGLVGWKLTFPAPT